MWLKKHVINGIALLESLVSFNTTSNSLRERHNCLAKFEKSFKAPKKCIKVKFKFGAFSLKLMLTLSQNLSKTL